MLKKLTAKKTRKSHECLTERMSKDYCAWYCFPCEEIDPSAVMYADIRYPY